MKCSTRILGAALLASAANAAAIPDSSKTSRISSPSLATFQSVKDVGDSFPASMEKTHQANPQETSIIAKENVASDMPINRAISPLWKGHTLETIGRSDLSYLIPEDITLYRTRLIAPTEHSPYFQAESALHKAKKEYIHHVIDRTDAIWGVEHSQPKLVMQNAALKAKRGMEEAKAKVHQLMEMVPVDKRIAEGGAGPRCSEVPFDDWPCYYAWDMPREPPARVVDRESKTESLTGLDNPAGDLMHASSSNTTATTSHLSKPKVPYPPPPRQDLPDHPGSSISYLAPYELEPFNTNPLNPSQQAALSPEEILLRAAKQKVIRKIVDLTKSAYAVNQAASDMASNATLLQKFNNDRSAVNSSKAAVIKLAEKVPEDKRVEIPIGVVRTVDCNPDPWMPFPCGHEWDYCMMEDLDKEYYKGFKGYFDCRSYESGATPV